VRATSVFEFAEEHDRAELRRFVVVGLSVIVVVVVVVVVVVPPPAGGRAGSRSFKSASRQIHTC